ncbi:MAG: hypothetical protein F4Z35_08590 [Dehalococcoidia bacterium]|nr:hypothetical protein [Dehalococcoidia bacterium]
MLADLGEWARSSWTPITTTTHRLNALIHRGLAFSVHHSVGCLARIWRYCPAPAGVETIADGLGMISAEWMRQSAVCPVSPRSTVPRIVAVDAAIVASAKPCSAAWNTSSQAPVVRWSTCSLVHRWE